MIRRTIKQNMKMISLLLILLSGCATPNEYYVKEFENEEWFVEIQAEIDIDEVVRVVRSVRFSPSPVSELERGTLRSQKINELMARAMSEYLMEMKNNQLKRRLIGEIEAARWQLFIDNVVPARVPSSYSETQIVTE